MNFFDLSLKVKEEQISYSYCLNSVTCRCLKLMQVYNVQDVEVTVTMLFSDISLKCRPSNVIWICSSQVLLLETCDDLAVGLSYHAVYDFSVYEQMFTRVSLYHR